MSLPVLRCARGCCDGFPCASTSTKRFALNGLDGNHSGSVANYSYFDANKNSGIVWNEETFKEYIKDPKEKISGSK
jgi:cytochrome c2